MKRFGTSRAAYKAESCMQSNITRLIRLELQEPLIKQKGFLTIRIYFLSSFGILISMQYENG